MTRDNQFLDYRNCADTPIDLTKEYGFAIMEDVYNCKSRLKWFFSKGDNFKINGYEPDEISFDRGEKVSSLPIKQTVAGDNSIEWGKEFELEFNGNHPFIQYLGELVKNEFYEKTYGKGLIALSNGGLWFQEIYIYNKGKETEYREYYTYSYLKISTMNVPKTGIILPDTNYALSTLVEEFPIVEEEGTKPAGYGLPNDKTPPEFTLTAFNSTEGITIDVTDVDDVIYSDDDGNRKVFYELYEVDELTQEYTLVDMGVNLSQKTLSEIEIVPAVTLVDTDKYYMKFGIFLSETLRVYVSDYFNDEV